MTDRVDPQAATLTEAMSPDVVLAILKELGPGSQEGTAVSSAS